AFLPHHLACGRVETKQVAHGSESVDAIARYNWCRPRPGGVTDAVVAVIGVSPENLAGGFVEAVDAFLACDLGLTVLKSALGIVHVGRDQMVGYIDAARTHGGPGVARGDGGSPAYFGAARGELLQDAGLAPNAVALGSEPLRPVVSPQHGCG